MQEFIKKYKFLLIVIGLVLICLLPTLILFSILQREFVDIGLLFTAILFVILILPIRSALNKYKESRKD